MMATHIRKHNAPRGLFCGNMHDAQISLDNEKIYQMIFLKRNLNKFIEKGELNQTVIAQHFGTSQSQISQLLNSKIDNFTMETLTVFAFMIDSKLGLVSSRDKAKQKMLNNKIALMKEISIKIKEKLKADGINQSELGRKYFNTNQSVVSEFINEENFKIHVSNYSYDRLRKYAYVCGITEKELDEYEK
ncbi:XRE family transcriptional regulator [Vibrio parahaemolyticus]|nr:XRE family transcriptional regulator [Vibrio parahaemolyticus]EKD9040514.1 XRE family transcriptional regulator [Vibrio parahaemolyticus]EME0147315.1 XRE family transcriptional regulator [Vibrio parahaemolyticus]